MKVLWLSRHPMGADQLVALCDQFDGDVQVTSLNVTFPADSRDAVSSIVELIAEHGAHAIAGVFPGHVAARLALHRPDSKTLESVWMPVSIPAPAVDGEVRGGGFQFSHWEQF